MTDSVKEAALPETCTVFTLVFTIPPPDPPVPGRERAIIGAHDRSSRHRADPGVVPGTADPGHGGVARAPSSRVGRCAAGDPPDPSPGAHRGVRAQGQA